MKTKYNVKLRCATCGSEENFECNEDRSHIKCAMCGREYQGGIEELKELNQEVFTQVKEEIAKEVKLEILDSIKNAFKGSKNIKIK